MENTDRGHTPDCSILRFKICCFIAAFWLLGCPISRADEKRLWVDAKINGKPVMFVFDTGAEVDFLFRPTAESLGLRITNAPADATSFPGKINPAWTETHDLTLDSHDIRCSLCVIDLPAGAETKIGGGLSWATIRSNIIRIDAADLNFEFLDKLPKSVAKWHKFPLRRDSAVLTILLPGRTSGQKYVELDTGDENGASLCQTKWTRWVANHPSRSRTLDADYMPGAGKMVNEVSWADELVLGPLTLTELAVQKSNITQDNITGPGFLASLGLDALKQLDLIVDGRKGFIYIRKITGAITPEHNRIGAVFVAERLDNDDLLAHILDGSPAYGAGIRSGDFLLAINGDDVTKWRSDPAIKINTRFREWPPGTKTHLKLKRRDKEFETDVVLRNLIGPDVKSESQTNQIPGTNYTISR